MISRRKWRSGVRKKTRNAAFIYVNERKVREKRLIGNDWVKTIFFPPSPRSLTKRNIDISITKQPLTSTRSKNIMERTIVATLISVCCVHFRDKCSEKNSLFSFEKIALIIYFWSFLRGWSWEGKSGFTKFGRYKSVCYALSQKPYSLLGHFHRVLVCSK